MFFLGPFREHESLGLTNFNTNLFNWNIFINTEALMYKTKLLSSCKLDYLDVE